MPQHINPLTWEPEALKLKELAKGINARNGSVNCARVALRLDEYIQADKNLNLGTVGTQSAHSYTQPIFIEAKEGEKLRFKIKRSYTNDERILERCNSLLQAHSGERVDLSQDREIIELDLDINFKASTTQEIRLLASNNNDIIDDLRSLSRRQLNGSAYGFMFYTWPDNTIGHMANFYVDKESQVFLSSVNYNYRAYCLIQKTHY